MRATLSFIEAFTKEHGFSPSFMEMRDGLGLSSTSGVHRVVKALVERGYLERTAGRNRSLKAIRPHTMRLGLIYDRGFRAGYAAASRRRDAEKGEEAG